MVERLRKIRCRCIAPLRVCAPQPCTLAPTLRAARRPPAFRVIVIDTGDTLEGGWETLAEARASLAFARLGPDCVEIVSDVPEMTTLTSW